jgi:two-component system chemotaxis response regulator CheB
VTQPVHFGTPQGAPGRLDIVAIAASAGGLSAISQVLAALPASFPAAIVIVQHLDPLNKSMLADILGRRTQLHVRVAEDGASLSAGTVLVAPPNHHLLVDASGTVRLSQTKEVHFVRPSADVLFESVASGFGPRALAVVLTGSGTDGATGVRAIKRMGGTVIAQDSASSAFLGMPDAAIRTGCVDFVVPLSEIAPLVVALVERPAGAKI